MITTLFSSKIRPPLASSSFDGSYKEKAIYEINTGFKFSKYEKDREFGKGSSNFLNLRDLLLLLLSLLFEYFKRILQIS